MPFHSLPGTGRASDPGEDVRSFQGNNTPHLRVPGLKALKGLSHHGLEIPLTLTQDHTIDTAGNKITVTKPLVVMVSDEDGCPVLMRDDQSNNGIWQAGTEKTPAMFAIRGEWDPETAEPDGEPATAPKRGRPTHAAAPSLNA